MVKCGRIKKEIQYKAEQEEIIVELLQILNIDSKNRIFIYDDLTNEQRDKLTNLSTKVKMYYRCSNWNYFIKGETDNTFMGLIRTLLKKGGYRVGATYVMDEVTRRSRKR